jgi:hypothetical protein
MPACVDPDGGQPVDRARAGHRRRVRAEHDSVSSRTAVIEIAFQNVDDFIRNLVCLRGELRSGLAVPVPAGVLKGTLPTTSATQAKTPLPANAQPLPANAKK